ncbi:MAG: PKD domain-containing protein [Methanosarcinales archaeon]|nr:PKD domain-containing protein [Methanosarcinales archaeon]
MIEEYLSKKILGFTMRILLLHIFLVILILITSIGYASGTPPEEEWNKTYGGAYFNVHAVRQTHDDGYIIAGSADLDFHLVKTDINGNIQWNNTNTIEEIDDTWDFFRILSIQQALDGGYILHGRKFSNSDIWLIKTDINGNEQWNKTFDRYLAFQETFDGGFIIAYNNNAKRSDVWLKKIDSKGKKQWEKKVEGTYQGAPYSIDQTSDGGYIITGKYHKDINSDPWLIKTDSNGNIQWNRDYREYNNIKLSSVQQTLDGGYILAGDIKNDFWLLKTNSVGKEQWSQYFRGVDYEYLQQTPDGGFIIFADEWTIQIDSTGNKQWAELFEIGKKESFYPTSDGGFILAGNNDPRMFWLRKIKNERTNPTILFTPGYPGAYEPITFDASLSCDPHGNITSYKWDFGDGNTTNTTEKIIIHSYTLEGDYDVNLTVYNKSAVISSTIIQVSVQQLIPPKEQWNMTYGGTDDDHATCVAQTSDGGYILAGDTSSYGAGILLVKTDPNGSKQWRQTFGGKKSSQAGANSVQETADGGYIIAGDIRFFSNDSHFLWLVKTDSNGNEQWTKTYGPSDYDCACSVVQTSDGGYIIAGLTCLYDKFNFWVLKTDPNGNEQWNKIYGDRGENEAYSVVQTSDGGYIIAGRASSYAGMLVKTDANGNELWTKKYGNGGSVANSVIQTLDGGYIIAGNTRLYGVEVSDFWVLKTDSEGNEQWNKTYGGSKLDEANSIIQTSDGDYIIAGDTFSYGAGDLDCWVVGIDSNGNMQWHNCFGGTGYDKAYSIKETSDYGYVIAGLKDSCSKNSYDFWLIKLEGKQMINEEEPIQSKEISIHTENISQSMNNSSHTPNITGFEFFYSICSILSMGYFLYYKKINEKLRK